VAQKIYRLLLPEKTSGVVFVEEVAEKQSSAYNDTRGLFRQQQVRVKRCGKSAPRLP